MIFSSFGFVFVFLPIVLGVFLALTASKHDRAALAWVVGASLVFYGWWDARFVPLLLGSIAINFLAGLKLADERTAPGAKRLLFLVMVAANLGTIAWFKYYDFLVDNLNREFSADLRPHNYVLPLAISFYTFTQIAYLADAWKKGERERDWLRYGFFVLFFPHLIAGPIVHWREIMPQLGRGFATAQQAMNLKLGLFIFSIGLFKKLIIADTIAGDVDAVFAGLADGISLTFAEAWVAAAGYTCQLYFDFSGYSDMAIGLSLLFGIRLPLNFFSPYQATSIIEFWRRWHITLSRFLKDYVYVPLGGNRHGVAHRYVNLMATMLIGGLWHGAGWTFVLWGALHGVFLTVNHLWREFRSALGLQQDFGAVGKFIGHAATFIAVLIAWGLFRAESPADALSLWTSMASLNGISLPANLETRLPDILPGVLRFDGTFHNGLISAHAATIGLTLFGLFVAWTAPNVYQMLAAHQPTCPVPNKVDAPATARRWRWQPTVGWAVFAGLAFALAVPAMASVRKFVYFQF
jgi:alginate O-acetyltransferase complex protein AlgI